jgi:exosome complex exonuclease DIS3/RRP44
MLKTKSFVRITRKQKVLKVVREHYLRDDIWCGSSYCTECHQDSPILATSTHYLIPDINVVLHQPDFLENTKVQNVILLQTVLEEVKNQSFSFYQRIRDIIDTPSKNFYVFSNEFHRDTYTERKPGESSHERNERAVRVAAKWYAAHLKDRVRTILLVNDAESLNKGIAEGITTKTVHDYVEELRDPELVDIVVRVPTALDTHNVDVEILYPEHLTEQQIKEGLRSGRLHQGPLRQNLDNWLEANVPSDSLDEDILIKGRLHMNRAIDGDIVAVELLPKEQWTAPSYLFVDADEPDVERVIDTIEVNDNESKQQKEEEERPSEFSVRPCGRVVGIIKRNWKIYCGSLEPQKPNDADYYLFVATDPRIPKIKIFTRQGSSLLNKRIVVAIDSWERNSKYPTGHYIRQLEGAVGNIEVESEALLIQHNISYAPFTPQVRSCLPRHWTVTQQDFEQRVDLRHLRIFSIDPPGCTDIDDALHIESLPNGNFFVGVHIADVSHFVVEGSALDREAAARGNTVYLVNKRINMLPEELSEDICSINQNVDRFAFSVLWEMTPSAEIVDTQFAKTIIRSVHSFNYEEAQRWMDDTSRQDDVSKDLRNLNKLARILRRKRIESGALTLASPEVKFKTTEENEDPIDMEMYQHRETNELVEEFMLLANISVAKQIAKLFPAFALLRRHPVPKSSNFDSLVYIAKKCGVHLNVENSKALADSLDKAELPGNPYFNTLLRILTTRRMTQARYFASGSVAPPLFYHYGLAVPIYTHFTSPIRRYADIVVHRLLAASIGIAPLTPKLNQKSIQKICDVINRRHRMAELASRESTRLHALLFFKNKVLTEEAYVTAVRSNGFSVIVPRYGIEGKVYLSRYGEINPFIWDPKEQYIANEKYKVSVFGYVKVQIRADFSKRHCPKLIFRCVEPPLQSPEITQLPSEQPNNTLINGKDQNETRQQKNEEIQGLNETNESVGSKRKSKGELETSNEAQSKKKRKISPEQQK